MGLLNLDKPTAHLPCRLLTLCNSCNIRALLTITFINHHAFFNYLRICIRILIFFRQYSLERLHCRAQIGIGLNKDTPLIPVILLTCQASPCSIKLFYFFQSACLDIDISFPTNTTSIRMQNIVVNQFGRTTQYKLVTTNIYSIIMVILQKTLLLETTIPDDRCILIFHFEIENGPCIEFITSSDHVFLKLAFTGLLLVFSTRCG